MTHQQLEVRCFAQGHFDSLRRRRQEKDQRPASASALNPAARQRRLLTQLDYIKQQTPVLGIEGLLEDWLIEERKQETKETCSDGSENKE